MRFTRSSGVGSAESAECLANNSSSTDSSYDFAVAAEALDLDVYLVVIVDELDLPVALRGR